MKHSLATTGCVLWLLLNPLACLAQATFTFNIQQPANHAVVGAQCLVQVAVTSTYELQTVTASIGTTSTNLLFSPAASVWTNTLSLASQAWGLKTLTITATDVFGNSAQTQTTVLKDLPPALTVLEPGVGTVAHPSFPINASATDDDPAGTVINVYAGTTLLATGTNTLTTLASLPANDGQAVNLRFDAVDSAGHTNSVGRTVYVLSNTNWSEVAQVEGPILDVSPTTILFVDGNRLKTKSRLSGAEAVLLDDATILPSVGALTAQGALFNTAGDSGSQPTIYEVRNGLLTNLGALTYLPSGNSFSVQANYALWAFPFSNLILRNLLAGTNATIATPLYSDPCLAPNGDVAYISGSIKATPNLLMRYRNGTNSVLANGAFSSTYGGLQTDGTNFVYLKYPNPWNPPDPVYSIFSDGATETILATYSLGSRVPVINQGWVAYQAPGSGGTSQVWTRSPAGVQAKQTFFGTSSSIQALAPNGQLLFINEAHLYEARPSSPPLDLGPWDFAGGGKVLWQQDRWYLALGRSLFVRAQPLAFTSANRTGDGQLHLLLNGNPNDTVITQSSTNLVDWSNIATNTLTSGVFEVLDTVKPGERCRFYRAVKSGH